MKKNNKNNIGKAIAVGAGIAALTAAGYFFLGPNGKQNRKTARGWMIKMKGEVIEQMEKAKNLTKSSYSDMVDRIAKKYLSSADKAEVVKLAKELKSHWKYISDKVAPKAEEKSLLKKTKKITNQ